MRNIEDHNVLYGRDNNGKYRREDGIEHDVDLLGDDRGTKRQCDAERGSQSHGGNGYGYVL
jgi:hypothetical protein